MCIRDRVWGGGCARKFCNFFLQNDVFWRTLKGFMNNVQLMLWTLCCCSFLDGIGVYLLVLLGRGFLPIAGMANRLVNVGGDGVGGGGRLTGDTGHQLWRKIIVGALLTASRRAAARVTVRAVPFVSPCSTRALRAVLSTTTRLFRIVGKLRGNLFIADQSRVASHAPSHFTLLAPRASHINVGSLYFRPE